jgi:hypothetical protein
MLGLNKQFPVAHTPHEQTTLPARIEATDREIDAQYLRSMHRLTEVGIEIVEGSKNKAKIQPCSHKWSLYL